MTLHALQYHGGKSVWTYGVGRWIASLLPTDRKVTYAEPYAGMLGVLLNRRKCASEIVNDLNGRVVNWWLAIRDEPDEYKRLLLLTPYSETLYTEALETLDEGTSVQRAIKFQLVLMASQSHGDGDQHGGFSVRYKPGSSTLAGNMHRLVHRLDALADRLRDVQLLCRPAVQVLERLEQVSEAVIYCDPPYPDTATNAYAVVQHDHEATFKSLQRQQGKVAISGYGDQWDHLGWHRSTHDVQVFGTSGSSAKPRTEVLWTNYKPVQQIRLAM